MREFDRRSFEPLLPPRRDELEAFAGRAAHVLSCNFVFAVELAKKRPEAQRFTADEFRGPIAEAYACAWTIAHCRHRGVERKTEKLFVLGRVFEKAFRRGAIEAVVRADEAYRRYLLSSAALRARIEAGADFTAADPPTADTLVFHAAGRGMESAARLASDVEEGVQEEVVGPEIVALEDLLAAARRFSAAA